MVGRDDQPGAGDGQTGRFGVAERSVLLRKPGNSGGGKGPWFKAGAGSSKAQEIGATLVNSENVRGLRNAPPAKAKGEPGRWSGESVSPLCGGIDGSGRWSRPQSAGVPRPAWSVGFGVRDLPCAKARCLVREPDALIAHVRFDEQDVETE